MEQQKSHCLYKSGRSFINLYSRLQIEMEQAQGVSCSTTQWCAAEGRKSLWLAWMQQTPSHIYKVHDPIKTSDTSSVQLVFTGRSGGLRGMVRRAEGVISASLHLASSQGRQTGKSILPLRTVHYKGLPQRPCLSESVPQARWEGTADTVGVKSALITQGKSCSRTDPERRRHRTLFAQSLSGPFFASHIHSH